MTYREALQHVKAMLKESLIEDAEYDAWYLMEEAAALKRHEFIMSESSVMPQELLKHYISLAKKRCLHVPLQYILGYTEFMGLKVYVDENVLIPRQETELLVEEAGKYSKGLKILDMCTGSGCIIISLVKLYGAASSAGADISKEALDMACKNAKEHGVDVDFINSNLFQNIKERYDIIISNPPYIKSSIIEGLMPEVRNYEPKAALDGGADGLWFYREIAKNAPKHLTPHGRILLEIGHDQAESVSSLLNLNDFTDISVKKDYSGNERIISAVYAPKL